uniref:Uncharacterized protein n=1 Tax=Anguilla anguilla TaxID=7936 RepID=A0A0E9SSC8_ANGAN
MYIWVFLTFIQDVQVLPLCFTPRGSGATIKICPHILTVFTSDDHDATTVLLRKLVHTITAI